jgi:general secretion pathway protein M
VKAWFSSLAPRERLMVIAAAAVIGLALAYLSVWEPLASGIRHSEQGVQEQRALMQWMQQAAAEAKQLRGSAGATAGDTGHSLLAVVDQTAKQSQLGSAVKRIQPDGQDLVRVSLEQASFDDVVLWLGNLHRANRVKVVDASIDRQSQAGLVNARITLKKASP